MFEGVYNISRTAGTTNHTISTLFGGTAVLASIGYLAQYNTSTGAAISAVSQRWVNVATATIVTATSTSATENVNIIIKGTVRVTTGGTFIPQFLYSVAPGGVPSININSYFKITPIGNATVTYVGNWI